MKNEKKSAAVEAPVEEKEETPVKEAQNLDAKAPDFAVNVPNQKEVNIYTIDELSSNAAVLEANSDIVRAALRCAGKNEATLKDARDIVKAFKEMEVK